jgi:hypothetical protein
MKTLRIEERQSRIFILAILFTKFLEDVIRENFMNSKDINERLIKTFNDNEYTLLGKDEMIWKN